MSSRGGPRNYQPEAMEKLGVKLQASVSHITHLWYCSKAQYRIIFAFWCSLLFHLREQPVTIGI